MSRARACKDLTCSSRSSACAASSTSLAFNRWEGRCSVLWRYTALSESSNRFATLRYGAPLTSASSKLYLLGWSHTVHRLGIELTFPPALGLAVGAPTFTRLILFLRFPLPNALLVPDWPHGKQAVGARYAAEVPPRKVGEHGIPLEPQPLAQRRGIKDLV